MLAQCVSLTDKDSWPGRVLLPLRRSDPLSRLRLPCASLSSHVFLVFPSTVN